VLSTEFRARTAVRPSFLDDQDLETARWVGTVTYDL